MIPYLVTIVANVLGDDFDTLAETIPGVAGDDYPIFAEVPDTSFLCEGQVMTSLETLLDNDIKKKSILTKFIYLNSNFIFYKYTSFYTF